jgi:sugar lactone lactonase YvrE
MSIEVGLDTVAFIESHYVKERGLSSEKTVDFLKQNYLDDGKLGNKSPKGGLYPPVGGRKSSANGNSTGPKILALDIGLSAATPTTTSGEILELSSDGKIQRVLVPNQCLPDGISVDPTSNRMFWTCMGVPGKDDGAVYSANVDGSDIQTVVPHGRVNTPKQLTIDEKAKKLYFCDREGCGVYRCNFDGSDFEVLIDRRSSKDSQGDAISDWCVGITVAPSLGKFYWTQKGPSKGGKGRIFCANINTPDGQSATSRDDVRLFLGGLPEPIDLEVDEQSRTLYWTDRGEYPFGNSLNRAPLDVSGLPVANSPDKNYEVLTRHLKEAIGLKLDLDNGHVYLADLGGNVYRCDLDGNNKEKLHSDDYRAFTGIALL